MVKTNEPGYVYILTNPSFREDWVKIGKSARPVDIRSKELDNTAVLLPFEIYATIQTVKYNDVEKHVHKTIDRLTDLRIRQNREFFNVPPQIALDIFNDIAKMIDDAVVTVYVDNKPVCHNEKDSLPVVQKRTVKRGRFKFSMVGIKIGECVTFIPTDTEVRFISFTDEENGKCGSRFYTSSLTQVASDDSVEYEGRIYKLSPFVGTFMPEEKRNTSGAYQGAKYFSYKGKVLDDLRSIIESNIPLPESDVIQDNIEQ